MSDAPPARHPRLSVVGRGRAATVEKARSAIADPDNECLLSLVSYSEMAVKLSLGKLALTKDIGRFIPEQLAANAFQPLGIAARHVFRVAELPFHHRDPFDRLLVAQALEEDLSIVTRDRVFRSYGVARIW